MKSKSLVGRGRILVLMLIMAAIAVGAATHSMLVLWQASFEEQRDHLVQLVRQRAQLIDAMARHDDGFDRQGPLSKRDAILLAQMVRIPARLDGVGDSRIITLARHDGDAVIDVIADHRAEDSTLRPASGGSTIGEAMRRALTGQSGSIETTDERGASVLAAYEPVAALGWGIVAQVDLSEVRAPFVEAGSISALGALVIIALGGLILHRIGSPLVEQIETTLAGLVHTQRLAQVGSWEWDMASDVVSWSDETYRILGRDPDQGDLGFDDFMETVHPDDQERVRGSIEAAIDGNVTYTHDRRIVRPDGTERIVHGQGEVVYDGRGRPAKMTGTIQDVTDRRHAEDALRDSEGRYRSLVELSPMPVIVHRDGVFLYANSAAADLVGVTSAAALIDRPLEDHVDPDYRSQLKSRLKDLEDGEPTVPITDYVLVRQDGQPITVEAVGANIVFEGVPAIQTVLRDVTERRRTEAAIRESEGRLRAILESSPIGVAITSPADGEILFANSGLSEMYGKAAEDIIGTPLSRYYADPQIDAEFRHRLDDQNSILNAEVFFNGTGDTSFCSLLTLQRIEFEGAPAVSAWIHDITDWKAAEEEIQRQQTLFEAVFRDVPDAMVLTDPNRQIIMANPAVTRTFGYAAAEVLGKETAVLYESREEFDRQGKIRFNLSAGDSRKPYFVSYRRKNGEVFPGETVGTPIRDRHGDVLGFVGVIRDISERVEADAALKDGEARLRAILTNVDEGISLVDSDLNLVAYNRRFLELLEFPESLISEDPRFEDFVRFNAERGEYGFGDIDTLVGQRVELAKEFLPHRFERARPDGTTIEIRGNPIPDGGFVTTYTDITDRRRAEEALRESEARFRTLTDSSNHGILVHRHRRPLYANPALLHMFGFESLADLKELKTTELLIAEADRERFRTYHESRLRGESVPSEMEMRAVRADGTETWLNILAFRIELDDEPAVCTTMMDITERKRAEAALRESEARFRTLVEHAPEAIVVFDVEDGRFIDVNRNAEDLFGADRQTLLGSSPADFSPPTQPDGRPSTDGAREMIDRAMSGETPIFEWVHRTVGGDDIPCEVRLVRLPATDRALVRGSVTDITRRKRAELLQRGRNTVLEMLAAGRPLEQVLATLIETIEAAEPAMLCSVLLVDEDGEQLRLAAAPSLPDFYNQAIDGLPIGPGIGSCGTCAHTGEPVIVEDVRGHPDWEPFRDLADEAGLRASWSQPIGPAGGAVLGTFAMYYREPGVPTATQVQLIEGAAHVAGIAISRRRDEDKVRRQNEELAHVRRLSLMGELATGLAHEINQPLTVISSYAQGCMKWLDADQDRSEDIQWAVGQIAQQASRASDVIEHIRSFVRTQEVHRTPADINVVIKDAIALSGIATDRTDVDLDLRLGTDLPLVAIDQVQVQQVILNLIHNGLDAMHDKGPGQRQLIVVSEHADAGAVAISVQDTGGGIDPEVAEQIFDAFVTTKVDGLGLGLSICASIVESHGGRLSGRSDDPSGAVFRFTLPIEREAGDHDQ